MNKNDIRYIKTEEDLIRSFICCLKDEGLNKTTVSAICKKARISRNTFYLHHQDKYELMEKLYVDFENEIYLREKPDILQNMRDHDFYEAVRWYIGLVAEKHELVYVLIKESEERFRKLMQFLYVDHLYDEYEEYKEKQSELTNRIISSYMVDGMVGFAKTWLNDFDSLTTEDAITLMMKLCQGPSELYIKTIMD